MPADLNSAERNYSTTDRDGLVVVWALNKFRGYIESSKMTVASDHQLLKWLLKLKSPCGRLPLWSLQLQSFNLYLGYIPGNSNVVTDMLSGLDCDQELPSCEENTVSIDFCTRSPMEIREEQLKDEDLQKIIHCFENDDKDVNHANWLERRDKILKEHHDSPIAAHYGSDGTYQRIAKRYFWMGMRKFITNYVENCLDCARFKASNQNLLGCYKLQCKHKDSKP
ncbi:hypothetical protein AVEN_68955-1 [Araneus ventricosus]|uniref:RNA-directed DNA polymerase n=1 Tax=Araneus ventricosus TaxID=182803 RepID=A0A4Y2HI15_ARAVE|nr:hypothetical protein AVEN_68955-1 [Araneus ventricosus]